MADNITATQTPIDEGKKVSFLPHHLPTVKAGDYTIEPSLVFNIGQSVKETFGASLTFEVAGPRFQLNPAEIHTVFPPKDSLGEFDNVLPHIELTRSTLPWERTAQKDKREVPWLGLILLQEEELNDPEKVEILRQPWKTLRDALSLPAELSDEPEDAKKPFPDVKTLQVQEAFLKNILPTATDLRWLTHVRAGHDLHGNRFERATLVCNRMPKQGSRAEVHLVSFEGAFNETDNFDFSKRRNDTNKKIQLLSLYSWQFTCPSSDEYKVSDKAIKALEKETWVNNLTAAFPEGEERDLLYRGKLNFVAAVKAKIAPATLEDGQMQKLLNACHIQNETFKGLMDALNIGWMRVEHARKGQAFFETGSLPFAHGLRGGGKTASWYRGPFVASQKLTDGLSFDLPIRNSDSLLLYDGNSNMLDTSYAAAWELGRLLTISDPRTCQQIAHWKTSHAREAAVLEQQEIFQHLPFQDSEFAHQEDGPLHTSLKQYFEQLGTLHNVPFQYLVPHESLLPHESLRFFHLDPLWVECLLDGALSIGRHTVWDVSREKNAVKPLPGKRPDLTGFLLRSDLVSGWPSLMAEGYRGDEKLPNLRFERLGPNVLLVIFDGIVEKVDIHLPAEALHFGFIRPMEDDLKYEKEVKDEDGNEKIENGKNQTREISWKNKGELRIFDPVNFGKKLDMTMSNGSIPSGKFAVELMEGVPKLSILI